MEVTAPLISFLLIYLISSLADSTGACGAYGHSDLDIGHCSLHAFVFAFVFAFALDLAARALGGVAGISGA